MIGHNRMPDRTGLQGFLLRLGFIGALALLFATGQSGSPVLGIFSALLFWGAVGAGVAAMLAGEKLEPARLTRWDDAMALLAFSHLANMMAPGAMG